MLRKNFNMLLSGMGLWLVMAMTGSVGVALSGHSYAQEEDEFKPPMMGAPTRRAGAGTREAGDILLYSLAPEGTSKILSSQPNLYWYISEAPEAPVRLMLRKIKPVTAEDKNPVLETMLTVDSKGMHKITLADYEVELETDALYEWSVSLVTANNSARILASATMQKAEMPSELAEKQDGAEPAALAVLYAKAGFWYNAFDIVVQQLSGDETTAEAEVATDSKATVKTASNDKAAAKSEAKTAKAEEHALGELEAMRKLLLKAVDLDDVLALEEKAQKERMAS